MPRRDQYPFLLLWRVVPPEYTWAEVASSAFRMERSLSPRKAGLRTTTAVPPCAPNAPLIARGGESGVPPLAAISVDAIASLGRHYSQSTCPGARVAPLSGDREGVSQTPCLTTPLRLGGAWKCIRRSRGHCVWPCNRLLATICLGASWARMAPWTYSEYCAGRWTGPMLCSQRHKRVGPCIQRAALSGHLFTLQASERPPRPGRPVV